MYKLILEYCVFLISIANKFPENNVVGFDKNHYFQKIMFDFDNKQFLLFSVVTGLISLSFLTFSMVLLNCITHQLKKNLFCFFFSQICVHISVWFQPSFLVKCNDSIHFFNTSPWFETLLNFFFKDILLYHACLLHAFQLFQFSFIQAKRLNHFEGCINFQHIQHQLKKISFITFMIIAFHEIFIKLRDIFNRFKVIYRQL